MACLKSSKKNKAAIAALFERGRSAVAASHRLGLCCRASKCGRLCRWLVKAPGVASVRCAHHRLPAAVDLYGALADESFACPDGWF